MVEPQPPARTDEEIEALVREGLPLVGIVARQVRRAVGGLSDLEELISMGHEGLLDAARAYDPARCAFVPYARKRIRWSMIDGVRRDTRGRRDASRARAVVAAERVGDAMVTSRPDPMLPESSHASRLRKVLAAQAAAMVTAMCAPFADEGSASGEHPPARRSAHAVGAEDASSPEDAVLRVREGAAIRRAIDALDPRQREVVRRHYFEGERFDHIAAALGVSKSWLSRIHAQAMVRLAQILERD